MLSIALLGLTGCGESHDKWLMDITLSDFIDDYNDGVSFKLKIVLNENGRLLSAGTLTQSGARYFIDWRDRNGKAKRISPCFVYNFRYLDDSINDPNVRKNIPKDNEFWTLLKEEEEVFIAAIEAVDDGWFLSAKDILKRVGFYDANGNILLPTNEVRSQFADHACVSGEKVYQLSTEVLGDSEIYGLDIQSIHTYEYEFGTFGKWLLQIVSVIKDEPIVIRSSARNAEVQQTIESVNLNTP